MRGEEGLAPEIADKMGLLRAPKQKLCSLEGTIPTCRAVSVSGCGVRAGGGVS